MAVGRFVRKVIKTRSKWQFQPLVEKESTKKVPNPSCGWYRIFPFTIPAEINEEYLKSCMSPSETLCMVELCIENYPDRELDQEALDNVRHILEFFSSYDKELILRPTYDLAGDILRKEPQKVEIICRHLEQLGSLFREFGDHILMVQGMLLGNWGEMHGSRYVTRKNVQKLYTCLRSAVGENMWIAVRRPKFVRWITLDPFCKDKICLFNDAILSSETDMGTYSSSEWPGPGTWFDTWTRDKEIDFQRSFCLNRPNGGEVAMAGMPFAAKTEHVPMILQTMQDMHISYMNSQYDARVFEQWKNMAMPGLSLWSCYDEVSRRLGYRYVVKGVSVKGGDRPEELVISIENTGFSNFLSEGELRIQAERNDGKKISSKVDTDVRAWYAGKVTVLREKIPEEVKDGTWRICLCLKRSRDGRNIRFANTGTDPDGSLLIGELRCGDM